MGWLDETDTDHAVKKAIKLAGLAPLPVVARSLTDRELRTRSWRPVILGGIGFALFALLMALLSANDPIRAKIEMAAMALVFAVIGLLVARWWLRREAATPDPRIKVDVGADGIIVTAPGGAQGMRWSEIDAEVVHYRTEAAGLHYCGLRLESPFGTLELRDARYRNGKAAASAIIRGKVLAEETRQRAKAGIEEVA